MVDAPGVASAYTETLEAHGVDEAFALAFAAASVTDPTAVVFFCSIHHDGARIAQLLRTRYPSAAVLGCTSAGVFATGGQSRLGVSAIAFGASKVKRAFAAVARFESAGAVDVAAGVRTAMGELAHGLGVDLRAVSDEYVGLVLVDGVRGREEACNQALGNVAPLLSFVGGSAGDDGRQKETFVFANSESSNDGAALLLLEMNAPFVISKTCNFEPTGKKLVITKADETTRTVHELDGEPAAVAYARSLGIPVESVNGRVFSAHPVGIMIDGVPWIRSPGRVLPGGSIAFRCSIAEGMEVDVMRRTDFLAGQNAALADAAIALGQPIAAGVVFNCIFRRLQMDAENLHGPFLESLSGFTVAGFHTYGESWLGHINHTFTAVFLG